MPVAYKLSPATGGNADSAPATGHGEIDAQHGKLNGLINALDTVCRAAPSSAGVCGKCRKASVVACADRLVDVCAALLGSMLEHFTYEELLMNVLPASECCGRHVEEHKLAHVEILDRLHRLTFRLDENLPHERTERIRDILTDWLGAHAESMDRQLVEALATMPDANGK